MDSFAKFYMNLTEDQRLEIQAGAELGLDVSCYAKPEYLAIQMRQVRLGMEQGLDVSVYNKPEYDWFQMEEIRLGMEAGIPYEVYAKPEIDYQRMRQLRKAYEAGIDLSMFIKFNAGILEQLRKAIKAKISIVDYIKEGYVVEQLIEIRHALERKLDIRPYISKEHRGASIREIWLGLEAGLPVMVYANLEYSWQQMREIRLGMEARVDVSRYCNSLFSWQQMRELRLGLEEGLDVDVYKRFIYTAADMEQRRKQLILEEAAGIADGTGKREFVDEYIKVFVSRDEMEACIEVSKNSAITEKDILNKLKKSGICQGILNDVIKSLVEEEKFGQTLVVAKGKEPQSGKDGWYEFFFDVNPPRSPKILEDGSADFKDVKWFELVTKGQKLAYYHSAEYGIAGYTVTGKLLRAKKGREKAVLKGQGFIVHADGLTYIASLDGKVFYDGDSRLDVSRVCTVGDVNLATGNITFDGTIYIKGNVGSGVMISATENVYVDGYVEAAMIKSGGEVFLRKGMNGSGNGNGMIDAQGSVVGQFFEDVRIISRGDIVGQYCMNCMLYSEGEIIMKGTKGLLLGGTARAARGITAHTIGNQYGLWTVLNVGIDQETIKLQQKLEKDMENVYRELAILNHSKMEFENKYLPEVRNTMEIYLKIEDAIYTKDLQIKALHEEKQHLDKLMDEMKGAKVEVMGTLYEGTDVAVDDVRWKAFSIKSVTIRCANGKIVVDSK